jgi:hypothetical protein
MDTPTVNHLLQKHGVLKTFHISKVVGKKELSDVYKKLKIKEDNISDELRDEINKMLYFLTQGKEANEPIPGVMNDMPPMVAMNLSHPQLVNMVNREKKLFDLIDIASMISDIVISEDLTLKETKFVIGTIIKNLNLNGMSEFDDEPMD